MKSLASKTGVVALATAVTWMGSAWIVARLAEDGFFRDTVARLSEDTFRWACRSVLLSVLGSWGFRVVLGGLGVVAGWLAAERCPRVPLNLALLPIAACAAIMIQGYFPRATSLVAIPIALVIHVAAVFAFIRWRWAVLAWCAFGVLSLIPIDVTAVDLPGSPRFVPLAMGLPTEEAFGAATRGELVLGGCVTRGHEARWVWVW